MKVLETKQIKKGIDSVIEGINKTVEPIKGTMGAKGKFVAISDKENRFTKDGVSVADSITLSDPTENIGCELVKSAAKKTVSKVGDGTTATSVLLQELINKARKHLEDSSINELIEGMDIAYSEILEFLESSAKKVTDNDTLKYVATIASNSKTLGKLIADCYLEVGYDSYIQLEKSSFAKDTYVDVVKGVEFNSGYVHEVFINSPSRKCILENATIYTEVHEVRNFDDTYQELFENCINHNLPLVIIAPSFSKEFLKICVLNKSQQKESFPICLIKAPGYGNNVKANFDDIKALKDAEDMVDKIIVEADRFTIYPSEEVKDQIKARVAKLEEYMKATDDEYEFDKTKERIHKLQGTTAIIYTGGNLLEDQGEEYDRLEDALGSVRAAISKGYVLGGGLALFQASNALQAKLEGDRAIGYKIVKEACKKPLRQILENANEPIDVIIEGIHENQGYNVESKSYEDFYKSGIIDPLLVVIESLTNALTSTKLLINTKFTIINGYSI